MHYGNLGAMLSGLGVVIVSIGALFRGPAVVRAWLDRQAAVADEARARAEALRGDAEERRLDRRRTLLGWSPHGVETYTVALVTDPAEIDQAKAELAGGGPTGYVVLRVDEGEYTSPNRGRSLRMLIEEQLLLCRPPTAAEREALEAGFQALGIRDLPPGAAGAPSWY
jgi:hypothetical protein